MAIVENAGIDSGFNVGSSSLKLDMVVSDSHSPNAIDQTKQNHFEVRMIETNQLIHDENRQLKFQQDSMNSPKHASNNYKTEIEQVQQNIDERLKNNGVRVGMIVTTGKSGVGNEQHQLSNGVDTQMKEEVLGEGLKRDLRDLVELFSKLNPLAVEFVPLSVASDGSRGENFMINNNNNGNANGNIYRRKRNNYSPGMRRINCRTSMAQRQERIRRTVFVSDIGQQVTEEQLASLFITCGQVVDCRICGDFNSILRFAFIEFTEEEGARNALCLSGTMLGYYPVRVLPSKTAIAPVNPTFLPKTEDEREMCARTVYCANIDKKVSQAEVKLFFEAICGKVYRLKLLGDYNPFTRIAFVEFVVAESAIAALNCCGMLLGSLPIRVSPSKTPLRPRAPRSPIC